MTKRTTRNKLAILTTVLVALLAGCGNGSDKDGVTSMRSPQEKMSQLEGTGAIPNLERFPSIEGIDLNTNGVRDDIDLYIEKKYTHPKLRAAVIQLARATQAQLLADKNDALALELASQNDSRAIFCIGRVLDEIGAGNAISPVTEIEALTTNTKERLKAYMAYNKARSGSVSTMPTGDTCD